MHDLRFGCVARGPFPSRADWRARVASVDAWGFDTLLTADHIGTWPPFAPLVAAADVSDRLRFGVQVLNNELWNPLLLAREAAAVDVLTDGRLELGFGAGHAQEEHVAAGLPYPPPGERVDHLAEAVGLVRGLLDGETVSGGAHYGLAAAATELATVQGRVPIMIGGNGDRVLRLAARVADIVSFVGFTSGTGQVHSDLSHFTWSGLADRVALVDAAVDANGRTDPLERSILAQVVRCTDDRAGALEKVASAFDEPVELLADSPFVLVGSAAELVDQIRRLRDDCGVTYVTTFEPSAESLGRAIEILRSF
jgi:probable F420-dependent oxidoreductase